MKKTTRFLSLLLTLSMVLGLLPSSVFAVDSGISFTDVKSSDWFYDAVEYVYENGMMSGTGENTFSPGVTTTRGMIVTILYSMAGKPEAEGKNFADVPADQYYAKAVSWASGAGIVSGYGNGLFGPNDPITREQMALILYGYAKNKGYDAAVTGNVNTFADGAQVSSYAVEAMNWAVGKGLLSGIGQNMLAPAGKASRAEAAVILARFSKEIAGIDAEKADTYTVTFMYNYGDKSEYETVTVKNGDTVDKPANPKRDGYSFYGWYTTAKGAVSDKFSFDTPITEDTVLYAKWTAMGGGGGGVTPAPNPPAPVNYTVSFESNGGSAVAAQTVVSGNVATLPADPTKDGYIFSGWFSDEAFQEPYSFNVPVTADITLYAKWEITNDEDGDGVETFIENLFGTSEEMDDTDGDGLSDFAEIYWVHTDPTVADSDDNGILDPDEDYDEDTLTNIYEISLGTLPYQKDSDADSLDDAEEINIYNTDATNADTDGDGLMDGDEILLGLNPLVAMSDGATLDSKRLFNQTVSENNISESLLTEENDAVPSLSANITGNIDRKVRIEQTRSSEFTDSRAIVGEPIDIIATDLDDGILSFKLSDGISTITLRDTSDTINVNLICRYNDDGTTSYISTEFDEETSSISASIDQEGTYFVMNVQALFEELGFSLPTTSNPLSLCDVDTPAVFTRSRSIEIIETEAVQPNYNIMAPFSPDISVVSVESQAPSADTEKITSTKTSAMAQADIVFIIDTTGSMGDEIDNVKDNIIQFVDALKAKGISAGMALIDYEDITVDGIDSTRVHKNGSSNWFYDIEAYKQAINNLDLGFGGDTPECAVDALETARLLDMRASAGKVFVLVTDADYKVDNRYEIPSMAAEIELLKNAEINCSVVAPTYEESTYHDLYTETNGIFVDIYGDFYTELMEIADKIGETIVGDGCWIYLKGPIPIPVRLDEAPYDGSTVDTDQDGIPDIVELDGYEPTGEVNLDEIVTIMSKGIITGTDYGMVKVYEYQSSPVEEDTDFDGTSDPDDSQPRNNSFTGRMERYNKDDKREYDTSKGKIKFNVNYSWFFNDLTEYNPDLSVLSSLFASDIYENERDFTNDSDVQVYVDGLLTSRHSPEKLLDVLGLGDAKVIQVGYQDNDRTEISIGHHCANYKGEKKEIILVAVRGTNGTFSEWSSNFDVGAYTDEYFDLTGNHSEWKIHENHKGFDVTANRVLTAIDNYINTTPNIQKDAEKVFWVTGHSRGAGIANLVGAYLTDKGLDSVTYTFASPTTTTASNTTRYKTIFNIINEDDLIPDLPLEDEWNFKRYGRDKTVTVSDHSSDKTFWGTYKGGAFKDFTDINYNNNAKVDTLLSAFGKIANDRESLYHFTYADDTLELSGINHYSEDKAQKELDEKFNRIPEEIKQLGKPQVIPGKNILNQTVHRAGCYQTPGYFMQALADLAATVTIHDVAWKYEYARNLFVATFLSGMEHPHWTETYYLIAKGMFGNSAW